MLRKIVLGSMALGRAAGGGDPGTRAVTGGLMGALVWGRASRR